MRGRRTGGARHEIHSWGRPNAERRGPQEPAPAAVSHFFRIGASIFAYMIVCPPTFSGFFEYTSIEGPDHSYPFSATQALSASYAAGYADAGPLNEIVATFIFGTSFVLISLSPFTSPYTGIP